MKLKKAYDNEELRRALQERDVIYNSIIDEVECWNLDDQQLNKLHHYQNLSQFERDLLFLRSKHTVREIADLYAVSTTIIYNHLKNIREKL